MKSFRIFFIVMMMLATRESSMAAGKLDFATVDKLTYQYFAEKKWDSVIVIGKQALRQDIDYYFLRVRMGIAYFEQAEYFPATTHLQKARRFNSEDPVVANYLYYAYLNSGRTEEARMIRSAIPRDTASPPVHTLDFMDEVHAEGGYTLSSDQSPDNLATLMGSDSIYGEQDLYGNSIYSNLGLKLSLFNKISLTLSYNYLNFTKTKFIQYGHAEAQRDSVIDNIFSRDYFYTFPWKIHDTSFRYNVIQHEGHIGGTFLIPGNIKVSAAVHLVHVGYPLISTSLTDSVSDTAYYSKTDSTYHMFSYPSVLYAYNQKDTSFNNWLVSLALSKDFGIFNVGLSGSWSNLNGKTQKQVGASLTYYPLGNLNFYGTTSAAGFFQRNDKRLLISQVLGANIAPRMWVEADFYYGDYTNANILNGSVVYNNSDIIKYRAGATLLFLAGKHLRLSLTWQYFRKESQQLYYIKTEDPDTKEINEIPQIKNNPYNTNTLIGGITWKL